MDERILPIGLVVLLAVLAALLFTLTAWLRRTGRFAMIELGGILIIAFGVAMLINLPPSEFRIQVMLAILCLYVGVASTWDVLRSLTARKLRRLRCSFCNKSQRDVRKLITGPQALICDECVEICRGIIESPPTL